MAAKASVLAARAAISDVIALYCHAIDRRRWELMERLFHDDASYSFGPINGTWREFVAIARSMIDPLPSTHHQLGQTAFEIGEDEARAETYMTATHLVPADAAPDGVFPGRGEAYEVVIAGRYVDRFERRDGQWRIAERAGIIDWRREYSLPVDDAPSVASSPDPAADIIFSVNASVPA